LERRIKNNSINTTKGDDYSFPFLYIHMDEVPACLGIPSLVIRKLG
jgi:hypothetical protein